MIPPIKAAATLRTPLDLRGNIPAKIQVCDVKMRDAIALNSLASEARSLFVVDRRCLIPAGNSGCTSSALSAIPTASGLVSLDVYGRRPLTVTPV